MKQKNIINFLLLSALCTIYNNSYAYRIAVQNKTAGAIKFHIMYGGTEATCPAYENAVNPGKWATPEVETGACCASLITVSAISGPAKGSTKDFYPPPTGFSIACTNVALVVKQTEDNQIVVELADMP